MSAPFHATDVIAWTGARWIQGKDSLRFAGTSIDSRSVGAGELFVAIRGVRHDAHAFLDAAVAAGAAGLLVERDRALPATIPREDQPVAGPARRSARPKAIGTRSTATALFERNVVRRDVRR